MRVSTIGVVVVLVSLSCAASGGAQSMPAEYQGVLTSLAKVGDFKDAVLKVNLPRFDLRVTIRERPVPTPFGFGDGSPSARRATVPR